MRIRWTTPAARDLTRVCDYIEKEADSETARRIALALYLYKTSGSDCAGTLVTHDNDAIRADQAFRHLECRWNRTLGK